MEFLADLGYGIVVLTNQRYPDPASITPPPGSLLPSPTALAREILQTLHPELGPKIAPVPQHDQ